MKEIRRCVVCGRGDLELTKIGHGQYYLNPGEFKTLSKSQRKTCSNTCANVWKNSRYARRKLQSQPLEAFE